MLLALAVVGRKLRKPTQLHWKKDTGLGVNSAQENDWSW
jgi:hypothetical protein